MIAETDQSSPQVKPATNRSVLTQFNQDNARSMAARGVQARRLAAQLREIGELPKPLLPDEKYRLLTLSRVRKQLDQLFRDAEKANETQKDRIASAISRLVEVERSLACPDQRNQSQSRQRPPDVV